jgi:hypothetical protein
MNMAEYLTDGLLPNQADIVVKINFISVKLYSMKQKQNFLLSPNVILGEVQEGLFE